MPEESTVRYLTLQEVQDLHRWSIQGHGGIEGVLDQGALESAVNQPRQTVFGEDAYPSLAAKAAAYAFGLARNHPFRDGNKRVAFAAAAIFLRLNGYSLECSDDNGEAVFLKVAAGELNRDELTAWFDRMMTPLSRD